MTKFISLGRGGVLDAAHVVAISRAKSAPVKRLLATAGAERVLYLTYGEPRESVLLLDNGMLAVVSLPLEQLVELFKVEVGHEPPRF